MSWLKKIVSKINMQGAEQAAEGVLDAMPTVQCLAVERPRPTRPVKRTKIQQGRVATSSKLTSFAVQSCLRV